MNLKVLAMIALDVSIAPCWGQSMFGPQALGDGVKVNGEDVITVLLRSRELAQARFAHSYCWKVEGPNGPSYLLGTIHRGYSVLGNAAIMDAFRETQTMIIETDPKAFSDQYVMWLPALSSDTLDTLLGPELWEKLKAHTIPNAPILNLMHIKPFTAITQGLYDARLVNAQAQLNTNVAMESELMDMAAGTHKRIAYLEDAADRVKALDESSSEVLDVLKEILSNFDFYIGQQVKREAVINSGDHAAMDAWLFETKRQLPKFYKLFVSSRNALWLPNLEAHLAAGHAFIAIGTAHLIGEDGMLQTLKQKGYKITSLGSKD